MTVNNLCNSCTNIGCEFQSGIVRTKCAFYMPPHIEPDNSGNYVVMQSTYGNGELPNGGWIPVSERMPKDGQSVLFCDNEDDIMVGYHVKGRPDTHFSQDGTYEDMKNVRAWMPLPEPYKAESE